MGEGVFVGTVAVGAVVEVGAAEVFVAVAVVAPPVAVLVAVGTATPVLICT